MIMLKGNEANNHAYCVGPGKVVQVKLVIVVNLDCEIQCWLWGRTIGNPSKKRGHGHGGISNANMQQHN
jgi:hypothetical protein